MDEGGIDGFNLTSVVAPESYVDFVDLVVPELQRRGALKRSDRPGPFARQFGGEARLPSTHPGARYRI